MATNKEMIIKFRDMASVADASYAMLHYVFENINSIFESKKWKEADGITLGNKTTKHDKYINSNNIPLNSNTAYARCIEARFNQDVVLEKGIFKDKTINNDPKNVKSSDKLSIRTINFTNRYELLAHEPNTKYGFSATLFKDLGELNKVTGKRKSVDKGEQYISFSWQ